MAKISPDPSSHPKEHSSFKPVCKVELFTPKHQHYKPAYVKLPSESKFAVEIRKLTTDFPSFIRPITHRHVCRRKKEWSEIPPKFAERFLKPPSSNPVTIEVPSGSQCKVHVGSCPKSNIKTGFTTGWHNFLKEIGLKTGQFVLFELIAACHFRASIHQLAVKAGESRKRHVDSPPSLRRCKRVKAESTAIETHDEEIPVVSTIADDLIGRQVFRSSTDFGFIEFCQLAPPLYLIVYEDGDEEELEWEDVRNLRMGRSKKSMGEYVSSVGLLTGERFRRHLLGAMVQKQFMDENGQLAWFCGIIEKETRVKLYTVKWVDGSFSMDIDEDDIKEMLVPPVEVVQTRDFGTNVLMLENGGGCTASEVCLPSFGSNNNVDKNDENGALT